MCLVGSLLLCFLPACGYNIIHYRTAGARAPTLSLITFENDSQEVGIELLVSEALRREVLSRGGLRLVGDPDTATYTLRGRVLPVDTVGRSFTGSVRAVEYRITLKLELRIDGQDGFSLEFPRRELEASDLYLASADLEAGRKNRVEVLRRLSGILARRIHDGIDREVLKVMQ